MSVFSALIDAATETARRKSRAAGLSVLAVVFLLIGIAFLTSALWMLLAAWQGSLFAAQVLGASFSALGLILFAVARSQSRAPRPAPRDQRAADPATKSAEIDPMIRLIEGFLMGLEAGRRSARSRDRSKD